jgi:dCTP deaminase
MAILTGDEIRHQRALGNIVIDPWEPSHCGENSYDLRLGDKLLVYDLRPTLNTFSPTLDMRKENPVLETTIPPEGFVLEPGTLYLGHTLEYTETKGFVPIVEGRSSVGRLGMQVHLTAGFGDNKFHGDWTLEISVLHPLRVYAGVRVCQIFYTTLEGVQGAGYKGKYQGQRGPKPSGIWRDFK